MLKKIMVISAGVIMLFSGFLLRPVPIVPESEALSETGVVSAIFEGGEKDVVFRLQNNQKLFYINRGLERGLNLNDLRQKLIGKHILIKYPEYWTPLDWDGSVKHLSKLEYKGEIIFNELKKEN